jgi:hypothetical protein
MLQLYDAVSVHLLMTLMLCLQIYGMRALSAQVACLRDNYAVILAVVPPYITFDVHAALLYLMVSAFVE